MRLFDAKVVERYSGTLQGFVSINNKVKVKYNVRNLLIMKKNWFA